MCDCDCPYCCRCDEEDDLPRVPLDPNDPWVQFMRARFPVKRIEDLTISSKPFAKMLNNG